MQKHFIVFLFCVALLTSCSSTNSPSTPPTSEFIQAKAGSTFTYDEFSTDSLNAIVAGPRDTIVSTVLRTNGAIGGKTGVLVVGSTKGDARDTSYYAYETNSNASILVTSEITGNVRWATLPIATGTTTKSVAVDSTTDQGVTTITRDSLTFSLVGTESITVKGQAISTKKLKLAMHIVQTQDGVPVVTVTADDIFYYYAPSLGFVVKTTSPYLSDAFGNHENGRTTVLIDHK
jgi:hypothetical protein